MKVRTLLTPALLRFGLLALGCGPDPQLGGDAAGADGGSVDGAGVDRRPYAERVVSFDRGDNAGFGDDRFPEIVLGPPVGGGTEGGSLDVLALGVGGEIVLGFGDRDVIDGPGPDFIVFENAFWPGGNRTRVFAELGEVSVSIDGRAWVAFDCDAAGAGPGEFPGCAGWRPTLRYDPDEVVPLDPAKTGGDTFDLADVGLGRARFIRIRDLAPGGTGTSAGFDLDAVGAIHLAP